MSTKGFVVASVASTLAFAFAACGPSTPAPAPMPTATARPAPPATTSVASAASSDAPPPPAAQSCKANETFCAEGHVRKCNAAGTSSDMLSACGGDADCHLTKTGATCSACAPGSVATCKDDATVAACNDDGTQALTDCGAQKKRCSSGVCVDRLCDPGQTFCQDGNVYRCNDTGSGSSLDTKCRPAEGVCWSDAARKPACRTQCLGVAQNGVLATFNCAECDWSSMPFCAKKAADHGCASALCQAGQIGYGSAPGACVRETEGLVVPDSEKPGDCQGDGPIGAMTIAYQVCRGGNAVAATRTTPCQK